MGNSILLFILGLLLLTLGVTWVHKVSKAHGIWRRIGAVGTSALGCFMIWLCAAFNAPAIINEKIDVVSSGSNWMILEIQFEKVRGCKDTSVHTVLINKNDQVEIKSNFLYKYEKNNIHYGFVTVKSTSMMAPEFFTLEINHACPLGIDLVTMTSRYKIPPEFNLATDDGLQL